MRNWDSPYLTDWFAISMRWLVLIGLTFSIGTGKILHPFMIVLLALPTLWGSFVSVIAIFNIRLPHHRILNVLADSITTLILFAFSGGILGPVGWAALLPITSAVIYYEIAGVALITLVVTLLQIVITLFTIPPSFIGLPVASIAGFNIATAVIVTVISIPFLRKLRRTHQAFEKKRHEGERKAQRLERDRMRALFEMIETFSATLNYQTVLETTLETGIASIGYTNDGAEPLAGAVLLFGEHDLEFKASRHFFQRDVAVLLPAEEGVLFETLKTG